MTPFAENFNRAVATAKREMARAADAVARADDALARGRELVLDVVALRFDPEVARRIRPVLEATDEPDRIYGVRSRAMASISAEDLLRRLGLSEGHSS